MSEQPAAPAEDGATPAKAGPKGVVLIGALVGSLLIGGAAGVFAVGPMLAKKSGYVIPPPSAEGEDGATEDAHADPAAEGAAPGGAAANLHLIDNLVLNPAGSGGARFLMLATAIEFAEAAQVEETKARDSEVRDIVLRVMGSKTVDELSEMTLRDGIKQELADSLGTLFTAGQQARKGAKPKKAIRRIYFPQFVIQ